MSRPIYLDYNATTPVDPHVVERMFPYLTKQFGNASSGHAYGYAAHAAMDQARAEIASLVGAEPNEIVITGGGSESNNLAIKGVVLRRLDRRPHVVSSVVDHPAVLNVLIYLKQRLDVDFTLVPVDKTCTVDTGAVQAAMRPETVLVSTMLANNEVGTIQPIADISRIAHAGGALMHVDAAQAVGKIPVDVRALDVDLLTIAGHKLCAPKGIGALYVRRGVTLDPLIQGSGQEFGLRSGTENVAGIVALGAACALAQQHLVEERARLTSLRDLLHCRLIESIPDLDLNGHPTDRLPNTLNVSFPEALGQDVLARSPGVAASTGAACHSGRPEPSAVLLAMGLSEARALAATRLSLGRWSTEEEVESAAQMLSDGYRSAARAAVEG